MTKLKKTLCTAFILLSAAASAQVISSLPVGGKFNYLLIDDQQNINGYIGAYFTFMRAKQNGTQIGQYGGANPGGVIGGPIAADKKGNIFFFTNYFNTSTQLGVRDIIIKLIKIDASGKSSIIWQGGKLVINGQAYDLNTANFHFNSLLIDDNENIFFSIDNTILKMGSDGTTTKIGGGLIYYGDDAFGLKGNNGPATSAYIGGAAYLKSDKQGNIYFMDAKNYRVCIRKIDKNGTISILTDGKTINDDENKQVSPAFAISNFGVSPDGIIYISDGYGNRIYKLTPDGTMSPFAGTGEPGYTGDGQEALKAKILTPGDIAVDNSGNVYFEDQGNNRTRKISFGITPIQPEKAIELKMATTLNGKDVTVAYTIKNKNIQTAHFEIYRSEKPYLNNDIHYRKIGESDLANEAANKPWFSEGVHDDATNKLQPLLVIKPNLLPGGDLPPDTRMPYVVVVARCNQLDDTICFKKWVLGVVTHGFDRWAMDGNILWKMSVQSFDIPGWVTTMAEQLKKSDGYDGAIAFSWMQECAAEDPDATTRAATGLYGRVRDWMFMHKPETEGDVLDLHLIGHSRGTVVVTKALHILLEPGKHVGASPDPWRIGYIQLTLLDPHPANNDVEPVWGDWSFKRNAAGKEVDQCDNIIQDQIKLPGVALIGKQNPYAPPILFSNIAANTGQFKEIPTLQLTDIFLQFYTPNFVLAGKVTPISEIGNFNGKNCADRDLDYFVHQSRYLRDLAKAKTIAFQNKVHDAPLKIPGRVNRLEVFYQHSNAYTLYNQTDQEFIQNLWGLVDQTAIDANSVTNKSYLDWTNRTFVGVGAVGHNQVPAVYEQYYVEKGELNHTKFPEDNRQ